MHPNASQQDPKLPRLEAGSRVGLWRLLMLSRFPNACSEFNAQVPFCGLRSGQLL